SVGRSEVIQASELDVPGPQAKLQGAEETVVLQGSHVGIRKKSAGIFSEPGAKGTDAGQPFVYRVNLSRGESRFSQHRETTVGASLLAMRACQSIHQ
ncbi:hypothetical protein, partial [Pseudomonas sp. NPDC089569]|uniref:hypothetical protein n=1 Tax=Pseudomonas sp. NPDC089569 TaxID=3390722 RepID=UPI003D032EC9